MRRILTIILMLTLAFATGAMAANKKFTLVIDAGHGGRDAGACGATSKEKNLTLKMALAFGSYVERNCPDVKVVYTRKTDVFLELWQRAEIANKNKADLFLSIHINAMPGGKIARGYQTYTLGRGRNTGQKGIAENLEVAKRENAVIKMEQNYQQHYVGFDPNSPESNIMFEFIQDTHMERSVELAKLMQRYVCAATGRQNAGAHQDNLAVLRLTSMPGCLLELGYISTPDEERFLNSSEAPGEYTRGIFNAFMAYKKKYFGGVAVPYKETAEQETPSLPSLVPDDVMQPQRQRGASQSQKPELAQTPERKPAGQQPDDAAQAAPAEGPVADGELGTPIFKVQIIASDKQLRVGDRQLKGISDVDFYQENRMYKYTCGASKDYNEIYRLRKTLLNKFPEAFIIAFRDGQKMDVREALKEFRASRNK